jgi:hypothetical protein
LGCQHEWETGEGDCSTAADGGGCQSRQAGGGEARGAALGEEWLTEAVALWPWAVGRRGSTWRAWPAVAGGWVFGREGIRRPGGAQGGADEAEGGPVRAGVAEALGGGGAVPVAPFDASASMTIELAWGWKVEEAPMAQLLGRSRRSGTARSTAADHTRIESRGMRQVKREENTKGKPWEWSSQHVGSAKPWAVGACRHRRGNSGTGGAAVRTSCTWSAHASCSCPAGGLGLF